MSTSNELSGSAGTVIQAGEIHGDVNFTYARDNDIGVVLKHEQKEVHLDADADEWFYVTVINRSDHDRLLDFHVESSAAGLQWEIISLGEVVSAIRLAAGAQIQLRLVVHCTATAPMAGSDGLKVLVCDVEAGAGEQTWWYSDTKPILIDAAPSLRATLAPPAQRVSAAGWYRTHVVLKNRGNTPLRGKLVRSTAFDGTGYPGWLTSAQVRFAGEASFGIDPGDSWEDCLVDVAVPSQTLAGRTWHVPLAVEVKRDDMPAEPHGFEIRQLGRWSDLIEWGLSETTWKRRTLAVLAVAALIAGGVIGSWFSGSSGDGEPAPVQAVITSAPTSSAPEQNAVQVGYSTMPCDPGTSVLVLHSLPKAIDPAAVKLHVDFETMWVRQRAAAIPALGGHVAQVSTRDATCPAIAPPSTDPDFTRFVWIGPFPAETAPDLCKALLKVVGENCIPAHVA